MSMVIADRGKPEPFLDYVGMDLGSQHVAGVAVPQLMQCNTPFLQKRRHDVGQATANGEALHEAGAVRTGSATGKAYGSRPEAEAITGN
jgi:hypothetical protein